ncbi:unnamed protein product, partial [Porites lobata]
MPSTRRAMNASTPADPGPVPADLELYRLYVKDLRSLCSRLKLTTTGGRDALIKRIAEARTNTDNLRGTPPPTQDGGEHVENENDQNALELQFQQLQRQVQELLDRASPQDGLLSASQLTQVQSIVQGSLNEAIEKAASAAAQAAVSAFNGSSPPATAPPTQARVSSGNDALQVSSPGISVSPENCSTTDPAMDSVHKAAGQTGQRNPNWRTLVFSSQDPHHQVPLGGPKTVLVTTSTGGFPVPEPLTSTPTNATGLGAERFIPGSSAPMSTRQIKSPPQGWDGQPPSTRAPATEKSIFGGVVTPVNVFNLYQALSNHPEREFVNKLCS